jgi:hypothetical protein
MNRKKAISYTAFLCAIFLIPFVFAFSSEKTSDNLTVEFKKASSGNNYTIIYKNDLAIDVTLKRPEKNDKTVFLCIAGAYTDLNTYFVDGLYIDNGKVYNKDKVNLSLGGGIKIINGEADIFPTQKGKLLNDSLINFITSKKGSFFQQIQMIENGTGARYKDIKLFQRRAIVKLKSKKTAVIESYEHITLADFTKDLLEIGVIDALYTDMGGWDEGWYRSPDDNSIKITGRMRTHTKQQCNWVVFRKK